MPGVEFVEPWYLTTESLLTVPILVIEMNIQRLRHVPVQTKVVVACQGSQR